jgi:imidazoleglycerol phosphate dehydratase HisB
MTPHIRQLDGINSHHIIEATKAFRQSHVDGKQN